MASASEGDTQLSEKLHDRTSGWLIIALDDDADKPNVRVVEVCGVLNLRTADRLEHILQDQLSVTPDSLLVDLTQLTFLGATGVLVLVHAAVRAKQDDVGFCLVSGMDHRVVILPLLASGYFSLFKVYATVPDAINALG